MAKYRLFVFRDHEIIHSSTKACASDEEAIAWTEAQHGGLRTELWCAGRVVKCFEAAADAGPAEGRHDEAHAE
jgi:hypothetical protein